MNILHMTGGQLVQVGPYFIKFASLILFTQFLEKILQPLASEMRVEISPHMPHAPSTMQVWPSDINIPALLQFLHR